MVLKHATLAVLALGLGACTVSIFEDRDHHHHGDDDGGATPPPPPTCGAACIGDAAADFNGAPTGATGHWRYLDDHRDRTWLAMTPAGHAMTGADAGNSITTCADKPSAAGCAALPGALLVSTAGSTSAADPALEFTAPADQVISLSVHALVPAGGAPQQIRVYRNSREDALMTVIASAGTIADQAINLDVLKGDRFLVAIAPAGAGASDVALEVFLAPTGTAFPQRCQFASDFEPGAVSGTALTDRCNGSLNHLTVDDDTLIEKATAPRLTPSVFPELGMAADLPRGDYFMASSGLTTSAPFTVQLWVKLRKQDVVENAWPFSSLDLDHGGGLGLAMANPALAPAAQLDLTSATSATPTFVDTVAPYQVGQWYFVRMVANTDAVDLCVNGVHKGSLPLAPSALASTYPPYLGRNAVWNPQGAYFDGEIDDFRVLSTALPCN
ncbi:MAG TPA: LamG domain-containing protein [Kofleriaceae bacterium]|nr:LamG domain-containing protein [Kofleriaceae bacterium]